MGGKVIVKPCDTGYEVEVWTSATKKSPKERSFITQKEAIEDAHRIMSGLVMPPEALYICCNKDDLKVPGHFFRNLTVVTCKDRNTFFTDERIFPGLRLARRYADELIVQYGDIGNWVTTMPTSPEDTLHINDNLKVDIIIAQKRVLWPD